MTVNVLNNGYPIPYPQKRTMSDSQRICNCGLFPHIFATYFAILWSAYSEKNCCIFLYA